MSEEIFQCSQCDGLFLESWVCDEGEVDWCPECTNLSLERTNRFVHVATLQDCEGACELTLPDGRKAYLIRSYSGDTSVALIAEKHPPTAKAST